MSGIDAVIARARRPGAFSERQRFTLARSRAIQKMRHFALQSPHFYVLELIQAAIASGARSISIFADDDSFTLSYIGGGFPEAGLANLFDFLFASKERSELQALRALALGVNALMLLHPARVILESGDGTLEGTSRLEIESSADRMAIGRPERPLAGTFLRAEGLDRRRMGGELQIGVRGGGDDERGAIETRCLTAPVPIFFNDQPIFGVSTIRIPPAYGYRRALPFDEGDLFGTLALDPQGGAAVFRILTHGVWIESIEHPLLPGAEIGGVINFDALHKTADHAKIVRDERLEELWLRLRPYAAQLRRGAQSTESAYDVCFFGGGRLDAIQLRTFLREAGRVVLITPAAAASSASVAIARRIAGNFDAPILIAPPNQVDSVRALAGRAALVLAPDLGDAGDVAFYTSAAAEPPARPWLLSPAEAPSLASVDLVAELCAESDARSIADRADTLQATLGGRGEAKVTIYTPAAVAGRFGAVGVTIRCLGRDLTRWEVPSAHAGHELVVDLDASAPSRLQAAEGRQLTGAIAAAVVRHVGAPLAEASRRALLGVVSQTIEPGTPQARLVLAAAVRSLVVRLRRGPSGPRIALSPQESPDGLDLRTLPLLRNLDGDALTLGDLPELAAAGEGVLYGVIPEVEADLEGLDRRRILDLDRESERLLLLLVGEAAYVRVDARDLVAEHAGLRIRDLAVGLRAFPEVAGFYPLVEGTDPSRLDPGARAAAAEALQAALVERYVADPGPAEGDALAAEELRRMALRHLQRALCSAVAAGEAAPSGLDLPITLGADGLGYSLRQILEGMREHGAVILHYDHGALPPPLAELERAEGPAHELRASPFLAVHLAALGPCALPFDFALGPEATRAAGADEGALLLDHAIVEGGLRGRLGVPLRPSVAPRIFVLGRDLRVIHALAELAEVYGVVGAVQLTAGESLDEAGIESLLAALSQAAEATLAELCARLPTLPPGSEAYERAITTLLHHAGRRLSLVAEPDGAVRAAASTPVAATVLGLPLFPGAGGLPISAWTLLQALGERLRRSPSATVSGVDLCDGAALSQSLRTWLMRHVHSGRVFREPSRGLRPPAPSAAPAAPGAVHGMTLANALARWIDALRPDAPHLGEPAGRSVIWLGDPEDFLKTKEAFAFISGHGPTGARVILHPEHWLVRWTLTTGEPRALAWLILAIYARINVLLEEVTGAHEAEMQVRVAEALLRGELGI
ncbi:MAG: hypothetical protein R3B09_34500 [Nannocystaceae bacterium]